MVSIFAIIPNDPIIHIHYTLYTFEQFFNKKIRLEMAFIQNKAYCDSVETISHIFSISKFLLLNSGPICPK